ncbi:nucleotidyltransferase domain-containing protein [Lactiplantibacillus plantarum]|uniref:nucleotidyltransferase domain-containing protein n=1 Tax=Lactiplantibacillus plantarum TaxID=1590 RepID=UPI002413505B|nr:nucleotidyltransferase [Lactiplantibacillus plantarum]
MPEKTELMNFYQNLSRKIQLSKTARETVKQTFDAIKSLIENNIGENSTIITFPQGSCSLGTTIKPLKGSDEDFDVDLIVAVKNEDIEANTLKQKIGDILLNSSRYKGKVEEKGRAWCITYCQSHIDVVPALIKSDESMFITDKQDNGSYIYMHSNPQGLTRWFLSQCNKGKYDDAKIKTKPIHPYASYTVLQKVVQILKYHRNIVCQNLTEKEKPISMLITVIAAELYENETNVFEALSQISLKIPGYLEEHKDEFGNYIINNPVNGDEMFTDKWSEHPEREKEFLNWANRVYDDLISGVLSSNRLEFVSKLQPIFGDFVTRSYEDIGKCDQANQRTGKMSYTRDSGLKFGDSQDGRTFKRNTFWGN